MNEWQRLDEQYILPTVSRLPIAIERGEGNYLIDTDGNRYLDLFTGLAVNVLGHSHPAILRALEEQGKKFLHISNLFLNPPAIRLARRLVENSFPGKVYFANSGAESTEAAIKLIPQMDPHRGEGEGRHRRAEKQFSRENAGSPAPDAPTLGLPGFPPA